MEENYDFSGKKILVVDDEEINWLLIKDIFEDTNANMRWARVGQEAIDLVASGEHYDLILMDMKMPILDGFDTTREIKKINRDIPVIAQTAYAMPEERIKCTQAGCDNYLSKPIEMNVLLNMVNRYVGHL
ncbi:MAG: response regulator [Bacteroidales bacterium]|nr:response regulator [Bacteroidales bacterium]